MKCDESMIYQSKSRWNQRGGRWDKSKI